MTLESLKWLSTMPKSFHNRIWFCYRNVSFICYILVRFRSTENREQQMSCNGWHNNVKHTMLWLSDIRFQVCICTYSVFLYVCISIYHRWFCVNNRLWFRIKDYSIINQKSKILLWFRQFSKYMLYTSHVGMYLSFKRQGMR